jgi:hypothetical protein
MSQHVSWSAYLLNAPNDPLAQNLTYMLDTQVRRQYAAASSTVDTIGMSVNDAGACLVVDTKAPL